MFWGDHFTKCLNILVDLCISEHRSMCIKFIPETTQEKGNNFQLMITNSQQKVAIFDLILITEYLFP